jgi:2-haloacid dehalogenase
VSTERYRVVLFDADDTLFDYQKAERHALARAMEASALEYVDHHAVVYAGINRELWADCERQRITQEELKVERFRRFLRAVGVDGSPERFSDTYLDHLAKASFLLAEAKDTIVALSRRYRLALVTNGLSRVQRPRLAGSGIGAFFEAVVISEEVRVAKPDPRIFIHALQCLAHSDVSSVLMVGDSLSSDMQGGVDSGMDTCWYNPSGRPNDSSVRPTFEVARLSALVEIL